MVTNLGGVTITQAMSYAIDWEAAFRWVHPWRVTCYMSR